MCPYSQIRCQRFAPFANKLGRYEFVKRNEVPLVSREPIMKGVGTVRVPPVRVSLRLPFDSVVNATARLMVATRLPETREAAEESGKETNLLVGPRVISYGDISS